LNPHFSWGIPCFSPEKKHQKHQFRCVDPFAEGSQYFQDRLSTHRHRGGMRDGGAGAQGGVFLRISPETWGLTSFLAAKVLDENG
jgi:hypothetical protein